MLAQHILFNINKYSYEKKVLIAGALVIFMLSGGWSIIFVDNVNVKALAQNARMPNGRVIDHQVMPGGDGEPIHTYKCVGSGICGH